MNFLAVSENLINFNVEKISSINLEGIGWAIKWLFDLFKGFPGAIALGVILFTLALKTLVLPLDIYSRVKTKKQSLLMKEMRPQMEKLQKQYAGDKNMYNQKVLELQRANGYNPLGACLPSIISLIIFIVVFSSFSTYSNYATLSTYNKLVDSYNDSVVTYVKQSYDDNDNNEHFLLVIGEDFEEIKGYTLGDDGKAYDAEKNIIKVIGYKVDFNKFTLYYASINAENEDFDKEEFNAKKESEKMEFVAEFVQLNARKLSAEYYRGELKKETSFLWIGNMWYPDSALNKEVPAFSNFLSSVTRASSGINASYEESYNEVTFNLSKEKDRANGYFILILLSIGFMFLQQFIMMRSQKDANELSTVDGSAASTNKMMMVIMPIIFGVFSFFYSAAFSTYMIVNTVYGLISMLIINKIVTVRFDKNQGKRAIKNAASYNRKRTK
ncbi:MAG: YidC/Oxa1 family membrane protein insertase [Clostridiales bacterium]|nr:YidC/Oxa1 family membrane protein insertase [Clostridiales bacterium]